MYCILPYCIDVLRIHLNRVVAIIGLAIGIKPMAGSDGCYWYW